MLHAGTKICSCITIEYHHPLKRHCARFEFCASVKVSGAVAFPFFIMLLYCSHNTRHHHCSCSQLHLAQHENSIYTCFNPCTRIFKANKGSSALDNMLVTPYMSTQSSPRWCSSCSMGEILSTKRLNFCFFFWSFIVWFRINERKCFAEAIWVSW